MKTRRMFASLALLALATVLVALPGATSPSRVFAAPPQAGASVPGRAPVLNPAVPTSGDSAWFSLASGLNGAVHAIAVSGQDVYVGGEFTTAGGIPANYIARWDGSSWHSLGSGVNGFVYTIAVHGTDVYVGGPFTAAGGDSNANKIARWDGASWHSLNTGSVGYFLISAIAVTDQYVYVGGQFSNAFGDPDADGIVRWDIGAHTWDSLGTGLVSTAVFALAVDGANLYVGGAITKAGEVAVNNIARWDGAAWHAVGSGLNNWVYALAMAGSDLFAGGNFTSAGGDSSANSIARWDGAAWHAIGGTPPAGIRSIAFAGTNIYVAGGLYGRRPYRWDGATWQILNASMNGDANAIAVSEKGVYVGGSFTNLGGDSNADHIAMWKGVHLLPDSIVYSRYYAPLSTREVRLVDASGANDQVLLDGTFPRVSPNRNYVAFKRGGDFSANFQNKLYLRNLATHAEQLIFDNDDFVVGYDWTNDSGQIVFDYSCEVDRRNADGTGLTTVLSADCYDDAPASSPWDGSLAVHNQNIGIRIADKNGAGLTHVPNTHPGDFWPVWSPDGQWISFVRGDATKLYGGGNYFKIHPNGSGLTQLTFLSGDVSSHLDTVGAWDSQKDHIVAPGTVNGQTGMYAIATDGSGSITRVPALYGAQADFVGAVIGDVKNWLYLPAILR